MHACVIMGSHLNTAENMPSCHIFIKSKRPLFAIQVSRNGLRAHKKLHVIYVCFAHADEIPCIPRMGISVLFKDGGVSVPDPAFIEKLAGTLSNLDDQPKVKMPLSLISVANLRVNTCMSCTDICVRAHACVCAHACVFMCQESINY